MAEKTAGQTLKEFREKVAVIRKRAELEEGGRLVETLRLARLVRHRLPQGDHMFADLHTQRINQGLHQKLEPDDLRAHHDVRQRVEAAIRVTEEMLNQEAAREDLARAMSGEEPLTPALDSNERTKIEV